jgi:type II secretory pathway pseudopilin PulG
MFKQRDPATVEATVPAANRNAPQATRLPLQRRFGGVAAFTLVELLVSVGVLALLVLMTTQLINSAAIVTTQGHKLMDVDSQARQLLDRLAVDVAQMVKRSDIDYYVKFNLGQQHVNDQIAFYGTVPGYYPSTSFQSPVSLVGYRINSDPTSPAYNKMERLGKGLLWNGVSTGTAVVFSPLTIGVTWPSAVSPITADSDYELIGPQVFRFEYYYLLTIGGLTDQPYDASHHSGLAGMQDVTAIVVAIAAIDPKSRALLTEDQIASLNTSPLAQTSPTFLRDYATDLNRPGMLVGKWQDKLKELISGTVTTTMPREALKGIRFYERYLYLSPSTQ